MMRRSAHLEPDVVDHVVGLPAGASALGVRLAAELVAVLDRGDGRAVVDHDATYARVLAPLLVGADGHPTRAPEPIGQGHVHVDVIDDDRATFEALRTVVADDPEALAALAQRCRLPVTPYRTRPSAGGATWRRARLDTAAGAAPASSPDRRGVAGLAVLDLTTMWAGPLATRLLGAAGARVVRVEPPCRPDGLRADPAMHATLVAPDAFEPLDLRDDTDRRTFERLVADADLVVESFSRRVMPNLGYAPEQLRRINPDVSTISIRAFSSTSPEADWVGYGGGVHASSGLGMHDGVPVPAPFAYLDPLTGLRAAVLAVRVATAPVRPCRAEVSLADTARRIVAGPASTVPDVPTETIESLRDRLGPLVAAPVWRRG